MKINILDETIIFEDKNLYPAFPSIIKLDNNKYLVSFRLAPKIKKHYSHLHSLSESMLAVINKNRVDKVFEFAQDDEAAKQDAQLFRIDDKTIMAYYFRYTFHPMNEKELFKDYTFIEYDSTIALLSGIGVCISYDNGETFSSPYIIKINNDNTIMTNFAIRGSMCKLNNNEILAPIYAYKKNINKNNSKYQCYIISTKDLINWKLKSFLAETDYKKINEKKSKIEYVEPSLLNYKNNVIAFIRTHVNNEYALTSISYSRKFITENNMRIATIPIGYADGLRRQLSNKGIVIVNNQKAPILGNICMDSCMIDVTNIENIEVGTDVYIWDNDIRTLEDIANECNTINYEILSTISYRVPRVFIL